MRQAKTNNRSDLLVDTHTNFLDQKRASSIARTQYTTILTDLQVPLVSPVLLPASYATKEEVRSDSLGVAPDISFHDYGSSKMGQSERETGCFTSQILDTSNNVVNKKIE